MRQRLFVACIAATSVILSATPVFAHVLPASPAGYVNDLAGVLSTSAKHNLETELAAFDASTTNQISIAIVEEMDGDYIEHRTLRYKTFRVVENRYPKK